MKKITFPSSDPSFYRTISLSKLTRAILLKPDREGMRPIFGFAASGALHRVIHLLKDKDYLVEEGNDPQQALPLYMSIKDRKTLSRLPESVMNRENLLKKHYLYYEGNTVPTSWITRIAAVGNVRVVCPKYVTLDNAVEAGIVRACAHAGELASLDIKPLAKFAFESTRQIEAFASDKDLRGHPDAAELWKSAFAWLALLFTEARDQIGA